MKDKIVFYFLVIFVLVIEANAETFVFESKNIEIDNKNNRIIAGKGFVTNNNGTKFFADSFEYFKDTNILKSYGNGKAINALENIEINFDSAIINGLNNTIRSYGNVLITKTDKKITLIGENIFYDYNNKIISSDNNAKINDNFGNTYEVGSFFFEINKDIIRLNNLKLVDKENNNLSTEIAFLNTKSNKLIGKDVFLELQNFSGNTNNEPRLKGNRLEINNEFTKLYKGIFTTCKKRDDCPPWSVSAKKIEYNKKKEIINYEDAILKVYDLPVMYFPRFFHPSPDVKRQSGFLIPSIQSSQNSGNYLNLPYYHVISDNKDITYYPRLFIDDKFLLQTEYRQKNKNSEHIADFSFLKNNKTNASKNHFFYNLFKEFSFGNFEMSKLNFKTQQTSSDTYFRLNNIKSDIDFNENTLDNIIDVNLYSKNLSIDYNASIYESLDLPKSDRYEYIFSKINLSKKIDNKINFDGDFFLNSEILARNYDTNKNINHLYNELNILSNTKQSNIGVLRDYQILIKNLNTKNRNTNYKDNGDYYFSGVYQINSSLPLNKIDGKNEKLLIPRVSLKISPKHTIDKRNDSNKIDINNVYSINRISDKSLTEGGVSLTYGTDYSIFQESNKVFDMQIANNLRLNKNDDLQNVNQIGEKTSNIFGKIYYNPSDYFETEYNFTLKNNLRDLNEENLLTTFKFKKLVSNFDYLNQNVDSLKNFYISNNTSYMIDENNSLSFSTRKNKTKDLTEYYNFMYKYKNDCLAASIEYNKNFYNDRDVQQNENLIFKLTIIPFGETSTPNLKK